MSTVKRGRPSGFTLIELLVVVAIVVVLISILLPSLKKAKDQARLTVCGSNQRQIALGISLYAQDYLDTFPYIENAYSIPNPPKTYGWRDVIGTNSNAPPSAPVYTQKYDNTKTTGSIWFCPFVLADGLPLDSTASGNQVAGQYDININVTAWRGGPFGGNYWWSNNGFNGIPPLKTGDTHGYTILLTDASLQHTGFLGNDPYGPWALPGPAYEFDCMQGCFGGAQNRAAGNDSFQEFPSWPIQLSYPAFSIRSGVHGGVMNVCYVDTHVEQTSTVYPVTKLKP